MSTWKELCDDYSTCRELLISREDFDKIRAVVETSRKLLGSHSLDNKQTLSHALAALGASEFPSLLPEDQVFDCQAEGSPGPIFAFKGKISDVKPTWKILDQTREL